LNAVYEPWWFAVGAVVFGLTLPVTRSLRPPSRLALRCLVLAVILAPQPLWAPGDGAYVTPAALLLSSGHLGFALLNGLMPVLAVGGILFTIAGHLSRLRREESSARAHRFVQRWVILGVALPFISLVLLSPWLAIFLFGGMLALWSGFSFLCLLAGAGLDRRAAREVWFQRASAGLLGVMLAIVLTAAWLRA
jgi:hypothetical protein